MRQIGGRTKAVACQSNHYHVEVLYVSGAVHGRTEQVNELAVDYETQRLNRYIQSVKASVQFEMLVDANTFFFGYFDFCFIFKLKKFYIKVNTQIVASH